MPSDYQFCILVRLWCRFASPRQVDRALQDPEAMLARWARWHTRANVWLGVLLCVLLIGPAMVIAQSFPEAGRLFIWVLFAGLLSGVVLFCLVQWAGFHKSTTTQWEKLMGRPAGSHTSLLLLSQQSRFEMEMQYLLSQPQGRAWLQQHALAGATVPAKPAQAAPVRRL